MKTRFAALLQREWLQHRFGWLLMLGVPLALALLLTGIGQVEMGDEVPPDFLPVMLAVASIAGTAAVLFTVASMGSAIIVAGLARRDHADRSVEFWLSLPVGHAQSFAAPLLVHLLLVPAAALVVGLAGGYVVSLVLVTHIAGFGAWASLPWGDLFIGSISFALRVLAGLPLSLLWFAPLVLLIVLMTAWFKRWGWVILLAGIGLGSLLLRELFGQPLLAAAIAGLVTNGSRAIVHGGTESFTVNNAAQGFEALRLLPAWALEDLALALRDLASPLLAGGLVVAAGCFWLLVQWRRRGAAAAG